MEKNIVVSVLCPLNNASEILAGFLGELSVVMRRSFEFYEIETIHRFVRP